MDMHGWDYSSISDRLVVDDKMGNPLAERKDGGWVEDVYNPNQAMQYQPENGGSNAKTTASQMCVSGVEGGPSAAAARYRMIDVAIVHEFLCEVFIPGETVDDASWAERRRYLCGFLKFYVLS